MYFGCCEVPSPVTTSSSLYTSYSECYYWHGCYDSTASASCTGSCASTNLVCASSQYPYCGTGQWSYPVQSTVSVGRYFFCHSQRYTVLVSWGSNAPSIPTTSAGAAPSSVSDAAKTTPSQSGLVASGTTSASSSERSSSAVQSTPTPSDSSSDEAIGLQKQSNQIALGCGVGGAVLAAIGVVVAIVMCRRHHSNSEHTKLLPTTKSTRPVFVNHRSPYTS